MKTKFINLLNFINKQKGFSRKTVSLASVIFIIYHYLLIPYQMSKNSYQYQRLINIKYSSHV